MKSALFFCAVLALFAGTTAGCFQIDQPAQWACSAAEPRCPAGLLCDGRRCVHVSLPDAVARDLIADGRAADVRGADARADSSGSKPDAPNQADARTDLPHVPCTGLADWTCVPQPAWVDFRCANRILTCDHDQYGWYCDCLIDGQLIKDAACTPVPDPIDVCTTAANSFLQGCCRP